MNLLKMSFSGAILIAAIMIVRAILINKLPKRTFLILWEIVLLRLLIPFSIPSMLSVYSFINYSTPIKETITGMTVPDTILAAPTGWLFANDGSAQTQVQMQMQSQSQTQPQLQAQSQPQPQAQVQEQVQSQLQTQAQQQTQVQSQSQTQPQSQPHPKPPIPQGSTPLVASILTVIWFIGAILCAVFFILSYFHWRFAFQTSLPVSNAFAMEWLKAHPLRRTITIRQSGRAASPLSYGIMHPVILMPQKTDWENKQQLQYILLHEYVHICRYDIVIKLISAFTLCIHWFNPMVLVMYILFNRDIELACDEAVIRKSGQGSKSAYALALISMEEKKSGLMPVCNNFSKHAIEERITAIMKMKKTSFAAIIAAVILVTSVTTAFATSVPADDKQKAAMPLAEDKQKTTMPLAEDKQMAAMPAAGFSDEEYEKLLALRFDGYENMTVSEYQEKVWELTDTAEYRDLLERFSKNEKLNEMKDSDETAAFLFYILEPLTAERWQSRQFSGYAATSYPEPSDNAVLEYVITLKILDADTLTVLEYNTARQNTMRDLDDIINNKMASELRDAALMQELIDEEIHNISMTWETSRLKVAIEYAFMPLVELTEDNMDEWEKERQKEWEQMMASYVPFGLTYGYDSATRDYKMYFQGKEVRGIYDKKENLWISEHSGIGNGIYDENAVELYTVYENGELAGLREATAKEQEEWSSLRQQATEEGEKEQEVREHAPGTEEDYRSLFTLKTPDYANMSIADFNMALLEWTNENPDRMGRISTDTGWNDFQVSLDNEELSFVKWTVYLSGTENGKYVQSNYTGRAEEDPVYNQYLPEKAAGKNGKSAWCSLWYQFSYSIADKNEITVGERDGCVKSMAAGIEKFWNETDTEEMLKMTEPDVVKKLQKIAEECSNRQITIKIDEEHVQFERMDERNIN